MEPQDWQKDLDLKLAKELRHMVRSLPTGHRVRTILKLAAESLELLKNENRLSRFLRCIIMR
jgi:hypothetical protein